MNEFTLGLGGTTASVVMAMVNQCIPFPRFTVDNTGTDKS